MLPIVILTYKRTELQRTWLAIAPELRHHIIFVVREEEAEVIAEKYAPSKVDVLPPWVTNVAQTRQWIWDKYSVEYDAFYQLDDDIQYFSAMMRRSDDPTLPHLKNRPDQVWYCPTLSTDADGQMRMFKTLEDEISTGVGITSPRPNWTFPSPEDKVYPRTKAAFVTGFYLMNAKLLRPLNLRWDRWNSTGDLDFLFQILGHGIDCTFRTDFMYNIDQSLDSSIHSEENREFHEFFEHWKPYAKKKVTVRKGMDPRSWRAKFGEKLEGRGSLSFSRVKLLADAPLKNPASPYHMVKPLAEPYTPRTAESFLLESKDEKVLHTEGDTLPPCLKAEDVRNVRYIYALYENDIPFYVGDTDDARERLASLKYDALNLNRGAVQGVKHMRDVLTTRDMTVAMRILDVVDVLPGENGREPTLASKLAEDHWIDTLTSQGHPITNKKKNFTSKTPKEPKVKAPATPKEPKNREPSGTKGGGWQIKPEWYGTGHVIRCKSPYDGSFWECDHDALYDRVNASLKAKGKTGLGEPGPSQKQYGASSGLREIDLWRRVD